MDSLHNGTNLLSIFDRMVVLDYYDGPVNGLLHRNKSFEYFRFDLLDWDSKQEIRIFSLSTVLVEAYNQIVAMLSKYGEPSWPEWVPNLRDKSDKELEDIYREIEIKLQEVATPEYIVAWRNSDIKVIAITSVEEQIKHFIYKQLISPEEPLLDWFQHLGINRNGKTA